jgi:hypothetical protein
MMIKNNNNNNATNEDLGMNQIADIVAFLVLIMESLLNNQDEKIKNDD